MPCEKGYYCHEGTRHKCPGGRFGNKDMETNDNCSGQCEEGYWCGQVSTSPTQNKCGSPNVYCPPGSNAPIYVSEGYYTDEDEPADLKTSQHLCPEGFYCDNGLRYACGAGTYGASTGQSDKSCDGNCLAGYYCLSASISPHQFPCGNSTVYCPEGSKLPILIEDGYYSATENEIIVADFYAGPNSTQQIQVQCENGFYCNGGVKYSCPAGTYGHMPGAFDVLECQICQGGHYCPSYPGPPTTKETQVPCGEAYLYCPYGSSKPLDVDLGYYSIAEFATEKEGMDTVKIRTAQVLCEPGFYCESGRRFYCPPGTYGETPGLVSDNCSGLCPRGFFCPENSVHPLPCAPGAFSTGGARDCTSCEVPHTVSMDVLYSMCRDDRSCCLDVFE
mmetsp:Transcript_24846/g.52004  ORF Transcript_24846/g.52004 Transcript_24846/m.52004 type:complete len:389 (+) Transcript_24846:1244-2410(+)